jgi:hypothetical protein
MSQAEGLLWFQRERAAAAQFVRHSLFRSILVLLQTGCDNHVLQGRREFFLPAAQSLPDLLISANT